MAASDTIVGIVGSVLLVGVMAGVFVYEYNNAPAVADDDDADKASFMSAYPTLMADEDLDGDGTANYADDDIDGDGIMNADDPTIAVETTCSFSVGANQPPVLSQSVACEFTTASSVSDITATVAFTPTSPVTLVNDFDAELLDDGTSVDSVSGSGTLTLNGRFDNSNGSVTVQAATGSAGGTVDVTIIVTY